MELIYHNESYQILGAAMHVYNVLGAGFVEAVYQEALQKEFCRRNIPHDREKEINIYYDNELLDIKFRPDFICYNKIIVELCADYQLSQSNKVQIRTAHQFWLRWGTTI